MGGSVRGRRLAVAFVWLLVLISSRASAQVSWAPRCSPETSDRSVHRAARCYGAALLRTRGYLKGLVEIDEDLPLLPACALQPPVPGMIYPDTRVCGGRGGGGPEAIEQSRTIAALGQGVGYLAAPQVQWEVKVKAPGGQRGYADLVFYQDAPPHQMQVWELKQDDNVDGWDGQVDGYRALLQQAVAPGIAVIRGQLLEGWVDVWLVPDDDFEAIKECDQIPYIVYVGWQPQDGLFDIYNYHVCMDPDTDDVPLPDPKKIPKHAPSPKSGIKPVRFGGGPRLPERWLPPPPIRIDDDKDDPDKLGFDCSDSVPGRLPCNRDLGGDAVVHGDPHLATFDGLKADLQVVGEFELASSEPYDLHVQARFVPVGGSRTVSALGAVAFEVGNHVFEIGIRPRTAAELLVDHVPYQLPDRMKVDLGHGASVMHVGDRYIAVWPGAGERPVLQVERRLSNLELWIPHDPDAEGLFGNADGDPSNDLRTGWGEQLAANASPATLHGSFADSWRISDDESLFTYAAGQSTATFTDKTFPASYVKVADLTPAERDAAVKQCAAAGVLDGPLFDDCVLDAATTLDATFVASAAQVAKPMLVAGAVELDASGELTQGFEGSVAPNFWAPRFAGDPALGTFVGPIGKDGRYWFSVPRLPRHDTATVEMDVIAIGDWTRAPAPKIVLQANAVEVWSGAVASGTPAATGKLATGETYAVYRVSATFPHDGPQLNVGITARGLSGAAGQAFGVDNVHVAVHRVESQSFAVTLPAIIASGAPGPGAGNLETLGAEDRYDFTLAAPAQLEVTPSGCTASLWLRWSVVNAADGVPAVSGSGCATGETPRLAAGRWTVSIAAGGGGTYGLELATRAGPQVFSVQLPAKITDGAPAGAGNLEAPGAEDRYDFTLAAAAPLQLDFSGCSADLVSLQWSVVGAGGTVAASGHGCWSSLTAPVPAGRWCLIVARPGYRGTYALAIATVAPAQSFAVTLPAAIADGKPGAGAGDLESTSAEDDYRFTTDAAGRIQLDFAGCAPDLYSIRWSLFAADGHLAASGRACATSRTPSLPAGAYRLQVTDNGNAGTYTLGISLRAPAERFAVTLPAVIGDGAPAPGAGKLESDAAEDDYVFTAAAPMRLDLAFSGCGDLGWVDWKLLDDRTDHVVAESSTCGRALPIALPASTYRLIVTRDGRKGGRYQLSLKAL